jgi:hypothetical protein
MKNFAYVVQSRVGRRKWVDYAQVATLRRGRQRVKELRSLYNVDFNTDFRLVKYTLAVMPV